MMCSRHSFIEFLLIATGIVLTSGAVAANPSGPLKYLTSNAGEWNSLPLATVKMRGETEAASYLKFNYRRINPNTGLTTDFFAAYPSEIDPTVTSWLYGHTSCPASIPCVNAGGTPPDFDGFNSVAAAEAQVIEEILDNNNGCQVFAPDYRSTWQWNISSPTFTGLSLANDTLFVAYRDVDFRYMTGTNCNVEVTHSIKQKAFRHPTCPSGFIGPMDPSQPSPFRTCVNGSVENITYYTTLEDSACPVSAGNPCDVATGAKIQTIVDYDGPGPRFVRTYRSNMQYPTQTPFGAKWVHNYNQTVYFLDGTPKPSHVSRPNGSMVALEEFAPDRYVAKNGSGLQLHQDSTFQWSLYLPSGAKEIYRHAATSLGFIFRLEELHDPAGRKTIVSYNDSPLNDDVYPRAITGPFGHKIQLFYGTSAGPFPRTRLDYILDPLGNKLDYVYDGNADPAWIGLNLTSVIYQDQAEQQYQYEWPNSLQLLIGITDEEGAAFATFDYDTHYRAMSTEHAGGKQKFTFEYLADNSTRVTDAANNKIVYSFQNNNAGLRQLAAAVDQQDNKTRSQLNESSGQRRLLEITDEVGNRTKFTYNQFHRLSMTEADNDPNLKRVTTYGNFINDTSELPGVIAAPSIEGGGLQKHVITTYHPGTSTPSSIKIAQYDPASQNLTVLRETKFLLPNQYGQITKIDGPRVDPNDPSNTEYDVTLIAYYETDKAGDACGNTGGGRCGQLKTITNALNHLTTFNAYYPDGKLKKMTDPNGLVTEYTYDLRGRLDTVTEAPGTTHERVTDYDYDKIGQIDKITFANGLILDYTWSDAHLLELVTDNFGNQIDYDYDSRGNRNREDLKDQHGVLTKALAMAYDVRNRLATIQEGTNPATYIDFDGAGNLKLETDPNTNPTHFEYDSLNRLIGMIDALNGAENPTDYGYDVQDNLTSASAPNGALTTFVYDDLGNVLSESSPDRGNTLYGYDASGNLTCKADGRHSAGATSCEAVVNRWVYTYDAVNRLQSIDYLATSALDVNYEYDNAAVPGQKGRLTKINSTTDFTNQFVTTEYEYDLSGNRIRQSQQTVKAGPGTSLTLDVNYEYNGNDQITEITYPNGRTMTYARDAAGRITSISTTSPFGANPQTTLISGVDYFPFGPAKKISYGNGYAQFRALDTSYRHSRIDLKVSSWNLDFRAYTRDAIGNIIDITHNGTAHAFAYDKLNRLIFDSTIGNDPMVAVYAYDQNGNRTARASDNEANYPDQTIAMEDFSNRQKSVNSLGVLYDGAGNVTNNRLGLTAIYGAANRLQTASSGGSTIRLHYNGLGELARSWHQSNCGCTCTNIYEHFSFDQEGKLLHLYQSHPNGWHVSYDYVWLDGLPIAQIEESFYSDGTWAGNTKITMLHADHLGTPRLGTSMAGVPVWVMETDAFGKATIFSDNVEVRLRLPGQVDYALADSGLYYNYFRDYDANTGRYLESDPIGLYASLNTYGYVDQNPLRWSDIFGLDRAGRNDMSKGRRVRPNLTPISIGVMGCGLACASFVQGDRGAQASMQFALGGAIKFCGPPQAPPLETNSCEVPDRKRDCGFYDPNCDNELRPIGSLSPLGPRGSPLRTVGLFLSFSRERNGAFCLNIGPHAGLPGPILDLGDLSE